MHARRISILIAALAGSTTALAGGVERGNTYSCTINGWLWKGGFANGDFMFDDNWYNCGLIDGPTPSIPIYLGPVEQFINGVSQGVTYPISPAVLMNDFSSPSLRMTSSVDITLAVVGSTYTCSSGIIGDTRDGIPNNGTATLELDSAVWNGSLTIGQDEAAGCVVLRGSSSITGTVYFGTGTACVVNEGVNSFPFSTNSDARYSTVLVDNKAGSTLTLSNNQYLYNSLASDTDDLLLNRSGATIRKIGTGSTYVNWPYDGDGLLDIDEGSLYFASSEIRSTTVNAALSENTVIEFQGTEIRSDTLDFDLHETAQIRFSTVSLTNPGGTVELINSGSGSVRLSGLSGPAKLAVSGTHEFTANSNSALDTEIVNHGTIDFPTGYFDGRYGVGTWRNAPGSVLTISGSYPFYNSLNDDEDDRLINEAGAILHKSGPSATYIYWPYDGDGLVDVEAGSLYFYYGPILANTINATVGDGALLEYYSTDIHASSIDVDLADNAVLKFNTVSLVAPGGDLALVNSGAGVVSIGGLSGPANLSITGTHELTTPSSSMLDTTIINHGSVEFPTGYFDGRYGVGAWRNAPGSVLMLSGSYPFYNSLADDNDDRLINEAGATIRKSGSGTTYIYWPLEGDGNFDIQEGTLTLIGSSIHDANMPVNIAAGARFHIDQTEFIGDGAGSPVAIDLSGDGSLVFSAINGPATLDISGSGNVTANSATALNTEISNKGDLRFDTGYFDGRYGVGTWRNTDGATLRIAGSYPFYNSLADDLDDELINESGGRIIKDGAGTSNLYWPFSNMGTVIVEDGTLNLYGPVTHEGTLDIHVGAVVKMLRPDPELKATTSNISGAGTLDFTTAPALFNRGTFNPTPTDLETNPDGLTIDVPFIQNDTTATFRTQLGSLAGKLTCTGVYDVGGTIDIQRLGEYEFDGSETFTVIEADFVSGIFGDYFTNATPLPGSDTAYAVRTGDLRYDLTYTPTSVVVSNITVIVPPCNPADLAEPSGLLDLADITAFVNAFGLGDELADLAEPFGLLDLADISTFVSAFTGGCP